MRLQDALVDSDRAPEIIRVDDQLSFHRSVLRPGEPSGGPLEALPSQGHGPERRLAIDHERTSVGELEAARHQVRELRTSLERAPGVDQGIGLLEVESICHRLDRVDQMSGTLLENLERHGVSLLEPPLEQGHQRRDAMDIRPLIVDPGDQSRGQTHPELLSHHVAEHRRRASTLDCTHAATQHLVPEPEGRPLVPQQMPPTARSGLLARGIDSVGDGAGARHQDDTEALPRSCNQRDDRVLHDHDGTVETEVLPESSHGTLLHGPIRTRDADAGSRDRLGWIQLGQDLAQRPLDPVFAIDVHVGPRTQSTAAHPAVLVREECLCLGGPGVDPENVAQSLFRSHESSLSRYCQPVREKNGAIHDDGRSWGELGTEAFHPASRDLDTLTSSEVVALLLEEDLRGIEKTLEQRQAIAQAAEWVAESLASGGDVIFAGAGTSGRLGVLEAAECPPTFSTHPERIRAAIAGGNEAVFRSREGAEDRAELGREATNGLAANDLCIGLSASSVTPYTLGALEAARLQGARTVLLTCADGRELGEVADLVIALDTGAEILTGSTRLKAGSATKAALNAITTTAMVLAGKVYGNLMVDLSPGSAKLRDRARRIVAQASGRSSEDAAALLEEAEGNVKLAIVMARGPYSRNEAQARLDRAGGHVRLALTTPP